jgi:diguanylate cyclase (GGDEF)-like protein
MPVIPTLRAPLLICVIPTLTLAVVSAFGWIPAWLPLLVLLLLIACSWLVWQDLRTLHLRLQEQDGKLQDLQAELDKLVQHDGLTLAFSADVLQDMLATELQRANRTAQTFSFALIAIDDFHALQQAGTGDAVLKRVAAEAMRMLRVLDRFGRMGEQEFGIILPTTWVDQASIAMSRLSSRLDSVNWDDIAPAQQISFCTGLTTNAAGDTAATMLERAREALNQAKTQGKRQLAIVEQALPDIDPDLL